MSEEDQLRIYALVGGIPLYHRMMYHDTAEKCIKETMLGPYSPLRDEAGYIVMRELQPISPNMEILRSISSGHVSGKEIMESTGMDRQQCYDCLRKLELIGVISPATPMCGSNRKEKNYRIADNLVRLYHDVFARFPTAVSDRDRDHAYDVILPAIQEIYGYAFEDICKQYVARKHMCKEIGSWWGRSGNESVDIDIVALCYSEYGDYHMVCECKFRNKETGMREMRELEHRSQSMKNCFNMRYCLFSRSGFTDELQEYASANGIELVEPKDMFDI